MKTLRLFRFWKNWGLISRLMLAVGVAIVAGGGVQTALLVAEGRADHSARLLREQTEALAFLAPLVADQHLPEGKGRSAPTRGCQTRTTPATTIAICMGVTLRRSWPIATIPYSEPEMRSGCMPANASPLERSVG